MGIVAKTKDDRPLLTFIEEAMAAYRARTRDPDYVEPPPYTPTPVPQVRKENRDPRNLTVDQAFKWIEMANAYDNDRAEAPALNAKNLQRLWDDQYKYRYAPRSAPFPAEELASYNLSLMQWHDVLNRVKDYVGPKESYGEPGKGGGSFEPWEFIAVIARKAAGNRKAHKWRKDAAVAYLNKQGVSVKGLTDEDLTEVKESYLDAHKYPRTYL